MKTYEELLAAPYNNDKCIEAFKDLLADPKNSKKVETALELSLPILNCVLWTKFRHLQPGTEAYDESLSAVVFRLFTYLMSDRFYEKYYVDPDTHFSLLFTICRSEIITVLKKVRKYENLDVAAFAPQVITDAGQTAVDHKIFVKQLPAYIAGEFANRVRFVGWEKDLCVFLAGRFIEGKGVPVPVVRKRWGTKNLKFFIDYVRVLLRVVLYKIKPDIDNMPSAADIILESLNFTSEQEMFGEGWHTGNNEADWWAGIDQIEETPEETEEE